MLNVVSMEDSRHIDLPYCFNRPHNGFAKTHNSSASFKGKSDILRMMYLWRDMFNS